LKQNSETVLILHSAALENRMFLPRSIKGSDHIQQAVKRLHEEGFDCELVNVSNVPSKDMRFYQVQADIIVDQLIYGSWGSTTLESLALGKPTICYLRASWKEFYLRAFNLQKLPIVEANIDSIYYQLKRLIISDDLRIQIGIESREFAIQILDVSKNIDSFIKCLESIE